MLSEESLLRSRGGRIKAIDMKSDARLQSSLGRICGGRASQMPDFASIVCLGREGTPHHVEIASLPKGPWFVGTGAVAILSLRLDRKRAGREQLLRDAYGLTKTESEIAILFSSGASPVDIATYRRVSVDTIRNQLKSAYSKTNTSNQRSFISLLNALIG